VTTGAAQAAGALGSVGLSLLYVATRRDLRVAGLAAWMLGCGGLVIYLAPHGHHRLLAVAAVVGVVAAGVGAWVVLRVPWLLAVATLACIPARIPVHVGSTEANLLLPMYGVVAVAALALAWELYDERPRSRELGPLAWPLALFVGWDGMTILWTKDVRQGAIELLFFVLPFGLLSVSLARLPWSRTWVTGLYVQIAAMALVFASIGIVQYETRQIFWNPKVRVDNAYAPSGWFYRVNSVFYDPSIYGRFLVIAILASLVVLLWHRGDPLWRIAVGLTLGITWAGLFPSFSQSSFLALLAGTALAAVVVWRWRSLFLVGVAVLALALAVLASPTLRHKLQHKSTSSLSDVTSGRSTLVSRGLKLAVHHPVIGVGVGGFKRAYADLAHLKGKEPKAAASHTTPITVAAETGVPGLLLFLVLIGSTMWLAFRRLTRGLDGAARLAFGLALTAILVHCIFYNDLFEDPTFWALLALVVIGARTLEPVRAPAAAAPARPRRRRTARRVSAALRGRWRRVLLAAGVLVAAAGAVGAYVYVHGNRNIHRGKSVEFTRTATTSLLPPLRPKRHKVAEPPPWPLYGFNLEHTRENPTANQRPPFRILWSRGFHELLEFPPTFDGHQIFVETASGTVAALNTSSGRRLWTKHIAGPLASSPAVASDRIVIASLGGYVYAMRRSDGKQLWRFTVGSGTESSPIIVGNRVYFGSIRGRLFAVRLDNGKVVWSTQANGRLEGSPAYDDAKLYIGSYGGSIYSFDARDGSVVWKTDGLGRLGGLSSGTFYSTPAVAYGRVYIGSTDGRVYSLSQRTGEIAWTYSTGGYVYSGPAVHNDTVYIGSYDHNLYALDAQTGNTRWRFDTGAPISGSATVVRGIVYISSFARMTYGLNASSGRLVWKFADGKYSPVVASGKLFLLVGNGRLYRLVHR
jgi:outer membrane protein assembly factor BamB/O-antigen ligase